MASVGSSSSSGGGGKGQMANGNGKRAMGKATGELHDDTEMVERHKNSTETT